MTKIDNADRTGDLSVSIIANENAIAGFQVANLDDAKTEASRIYKVRTEKGLPTHAAYAREILSKSNKGLVLGTKQIIPL